MHETVFKKKKFVHLDLTRALKDLSDDLYFLSPKFEKKLRIMYRLK